MDNKLFETFKSLLENGLQETCLQKFLERYPEILVRTFFQGAFEQKVFPKFELADDFVPDFVMIGQRSDYSWDVDLIEIEPAVYTMSLFNQSRQSTGRLRDAEAQIRDWQVWMRNNSDFFISRALRELKACHAWDRNPESYNLSNGTNQNMGIWYRIVIGRRTDFNGWGDNYRNNTWEESGHRIEIVTWDRLLEITSRF